MTEAQDSARSGIDDGEKKFFYLIGRIVTEYQHIEDFLPVVFSSSLSLDRNQSDALFSCVRGLEGKLDMVTAALLRRSAAAQNQWRAFIPRISALAADRNKIAHGSPGVYGELIVNLSSEGETLSVEEAVESHFRLTKAAKKTSIIYDEKDLRRVAKEAWDLFGELISFAKRLKEERDAAAD